MTATVDADGFQFTTEAVAGTMYYIGHNENFDNYRSTDPDFVTGPLTLRLRIGLVHAATETDDSGTTWTSTPAASAKGTLGTPSSPSASMTAATSPCPCTPAARSPTGTVPWNRTTSP